MTVLLSQLEIMKRGNAMLKIVIMSRPLRAEILKPMVCMNKIETYAHFHLSGRFYRISCRKTILQNAPNRNQATIYNFH